MHTSTCGNCRYPKFDPTNPAHIEIFSVGRSAAEKAPEILADEQTHRGKPLTPAIARKILRSWLDTSPTGQRIDKAIAALITQNIALTKHPGHNQNPYKAGVVG